MRIVVASPGDVQPERDALVQVVEELNNGVARDRELRLELARWETDAYPGFHPEGPQGLIDSILNIEDCDVLIGIFWKRFGTPTLDAGSGTEHEFHKAYEAWKKSKRRPQIMMYFNQRPATPKSKVEAEQWGKVLEFQERFPKEGLWSSYKGKAQFERLVRQHLTHFLQEEHPAGSSNRSGGNKMESALAATIGSVTIGETQRASAARGLREAYLSWLIEQVRAVPLAGVDPKSVSEESRRDLELAAVYTGLMTGLTEEPKKRQAGLERELRHVSAVEALNREKRLALLGDPGSGKSTFVNFVALCLASESLGRSEANLAVLRAPVPPGRAGRVRKRKAAALEPRSPAACAGDSARVCRVGSALGRQAGCDGRHALAVHCERIARDAAGLR
jgi:hypothetical protein